MKAKAIGRATEDGDLGPLWQRAFPSRKQVPIENTSHNTVVAQIHTPCPLRGTGDVHACYRMMEFGRRSAFAVWPCGFTVNRWPILSQRMSRNAPRLEIHR